ncbi:MAG: hypothetical protein J4F36_13285, partial [Nitrosopumilaceae archaeon]|nr:hypothetical protein [Nitrosopumilaceae archaeon]
PNRSKLKTKADLENAIESTILKYKEVIYASDLVCKECLNTQFKQDKINAKIYNQKLLEDFIREEQYKNIIETENGVRIDKDSGVIIGYIQEKSY